MPGRADALRMTHERFDQDHGQDPAAVVGAGMILPADDPGDEPADEPALSEQPDCGLTDDDRGAEA